MDAAIFEVLVKGGCEQKGDKGEKVGDPGIGAPRIYEDRDSFSPIEGHVHHFRRL